MALKSRVGQVKSAISQNVDLLVFRTAHAIRNEAVRLIQEGERSGRTYKRGGVTHQASAPGEPPKTDTGALVRSIRVEHRPGSGSARVVVGAEYGAALEFGTKKLAPRPFLRPAVATVKKQIPGIIRSLNVRVEK